MASVDMKKRFKFKMSDRELDRVLSDFSKRKKKIVKEEPQMQSKIVVGIPSTMLPQTKSRMRDVDRLEGAAFKRIVAPTKEEVLKEEKNSIDKKMAMRRDTSRTYKTLNRASHTLKPNILDPEELDHSNVNQVIEYRCKGESRQKERLRNFFLIAEKTKDEVSKKRKLEQEVLPIKKFPKLATGLEPGADEIFL